MVNPFLNLVLGGGESEINPCRVPSVLIPTERQAKSKKKANPTGQRNGNIARSIFYWSFFPFFVLIGRKLLGDV